MSPMLWHIGDVVRKRREGKGWTQRELARRAKKMRPNTLSHFERYGDRFEHDTLVRVATALGTTVAALYADLNVTPPVTSTATLDPEDADLLARYHALSVEHRHTVQVVLRSFGRSLEASGSGTPEDAHINQPAREPQR